MNRKMFCFDKNLCAGSVVRQTPQHQRRIDGDRGERVRGEAFALAVRICRGDQANAGRKHTERGAILARVGRLIHRTGARRFEGHPGKHGRRIPPA